MRFLFHLACLLGLAFTLDMNVEQSAMPLVSIDADSTAAGARQLSSMNGKKIGSQLKRVKTKDHKKNPPSTSSPEFWFEQPLDHKAQNSPKWKQRYFLNENFAKGDKYPVFLNIQRSGVDNTTAHSSEFFINYLAEKHKAMVIVVELRFFGKSRATQDLSVENLKYLSTEQVLADLVAFQDHIIQTKKLSDKNKWFLGGTGTKGTMAAWAKLKYPDRFSGALASSSPLFATTNFYQYADQVAYGLKYFGGDKCLQDIKPALDEYHRLVSSTDVKDAQTFNDLFKACTPLKNKWDRGHAEAWIAYDFMYVADNNDWEEYTLKNVCEDFALPGTPIEKLAKFTTTLNGIGPDDCINYDYEDDLIASLNYIEADASDAANCRLCYYLGCTEFPLGSLVSVNSKSMFKVLTHFNEDYAVKEVCKRVFGITNTKARFAAMNQKFGGLSINVANVIFSNGNLDGMSTLSLINGSTLANPSSKIVHMDGVSMSRDWYIDEATDSGPVVWAHKKIADYVKTILK